MVRRRSHERCALEAPTEAVGAEDPLSVAGILEDGGEVINTAGTETRKLQLIVTA